MKQSTFRWLLLGLIYMLFFFDAVARFFFLYWVIPWLDMVAHTIGGIWIGLALLWFFFLSGYLRPHGWSRQKAFSVVVMGTLFIGVTWELYEFVLHVWNHLPIDVPYLMDTASDLCMDMVGAIIGFALFTRLVSLGFIPPMDGRALR